MSRASVFGILLLISLVLVSALSVVHAKYNSRKLFVELQQLSRDRDAIDVEWGRLQLEFAALGTHGRVERIAASRLQMSLPKPDAVVVLRSNDGR